MTAFHAAAPLHTWLAVAMVVGSSTAADVLTSGAMKNVGDIGALYQSHGATHVIKRVASNTRLLSGIFFMAVSFYSLLAALSFADVSLVAPASASLTFVTDAIAAKLILKENVDRRRWACALMVCAGVALLTR